MTPAATIALAFIVAAPPIFFIAKRWGLQRAINISAGVCVGLLTVVLLTGCGESVSEATQNERRDDAISSTDQDVKELKERVLKLEKDRAQ